MVNVKSAFCAVVAASIVGLLPAMAGAESVNWRQDNQNQRIRNGWREGELTRHEMASLNSQVARIRAQEARDRRDGCGYTAAERARTQRALDLASRNIYRDIHNCRDRN